MNPSNKCHSHVCLACLGSNSDADNRLDVAVQAVAETFKIIGVGSRIMTEPEETQVNSMPYLNQAIVFQTEQSPEEIVSAFKLIELQNGRTSDSKRSGIVPLDIDLLIYDKLVLRPSDLQRTYVKSAIAGLPSSCSMPLPPL